MENDVGPQVTNVRGYELARCLDKVIGKSTEQIDAGDVGELDGLHHDADLEGGHCEGEEWAILDCCLALKFKPANRDTYKAGCGLFSHQGLRSATITITKLENHEVNCHIQKDG